MFGKLPRLPSNEPLRELDMDPTYKDFMIGLVSRLIGIRKLCYENLVQSKFRSKKYYDQHINPRSFKVEDYVFLLKGPKPNKLGDQYTGPHKILEIINNNNIKIEINKQHKIVHINRVRISHINKNS